MIANGTLFKELKTCLNYFSFSTRFCLNNANAKFEILQICMNSGKQKVTAGKK